jgi:hypothetical protein
MSSLPTKFVWSSVVKGTKQEFVEAAAQPIEEKPIIIKRTADNICAPETGNWVNTHIVYNDEKVLDVPPYVNERAMKFIELFVKVFPTESQACLTIAEFQSLFKTKYPSYVQSKFSRLYFAATYDELQAWVVHAEKTTREPWRNAMWIFLKNVTFENCMAALSSDAFQVNTLENQYPGYCRIVDNTYIVWHTNLLTYKPYRHHPKPLNKKQLANKLRRNEEMDNLSL